jgi:hypothetical protein
LILTLDNGSVRVTVLPELGAMVASLIDLASGREWLDQPPEGPDRDAGLDSVYLGREACGWDECFPTVNPVSYPEPPWEGVTLADHGELWSRPWWGERDGAAVKTRIDGARLPYRFERRLSLDGRSLLAEYELANPSDAPLLGLWAMHPLLRARPGMRVLLPGEVDSLGCTYSSVDAGAVGWELRWAGELARLAPPEQGLALKLFTGKLTSGRAALADPDGGAWLGIEWSPDDLPYLGLWLNQGGWPPGGPARYHVAFEPTFARADDLVSAARTGEALRVDPGGAARWSVRLVLGAAGEDAAAFVG